MSMNAIHMITLTMTFSSDDTMGTKLITADASIEIIIIISN